MYVADILLKHWARESLLHVMTNSDSENILVTIAMKRLAEINPICNTFETSKG